MKILYYVQSTLGIGHLYRSINIIKKLKGDIWLMTGGLACDIPLPKNVKHIQLPSIQITKDFQTLKEELTYTQYIDIFTQRKKYIVNTICNINFDKIVIEMFPFGKYNLKDELLPLLQYNQIKTKKAKVICSVRDILIQRPNQIEYEKRSLELLNKYFDLVLIHSDPNIITLDKTFSMLDKCKCQLEYTGFVKYDFNELLEENNKSSLPVITCSMGGGDIDTTLIYKTIEMSILLDNDIKHTLNVFLGKNISIDVYNTLIEQYQKYSFINIHRFSDTFKSVLRNSHVSISYGGYNTMIELTSLGIPSLIYPFNLNQEQKFRAEIFSKYRTVDLIEDTDFSNLTLFINKIKTMLNIQQPNTKDIDYSGVEKSISFISND